jgi:N-succinyldiaminopimelate aminotransferase
VAAVPVSAFYAEDPPKSLIRFCFAKRDAVLDEALDRLGAYLPRLRSKRSAA